MLSQKKKTLELLLISRKSHVQKIGGYKVLSLT